MFRFLTHISQIYKSREHGKLKLGNDVLELNLGSNLILL